MALISSCLLILNTTLVLPMYSIRRIKCLITCHRNSFNHLYRRLLNCLFNLKSKLPPLLLALRHCHLPLPLHAVLTITHA